MNEASNLPNGKTIRIDEHAHRILLDAKDEMRDKGINNPNLSDAIRWIEKKTQTGGEKSC